MHVTHNQRPFSNRIRFAPEVASKPDRLEKDLDNAKTLAAILEEEDARLRKAKVKPAGQFKDAEVLADDQADTVMTAPEVEEEENDPEDPEPKERGSDAVERRIEKIMADRRDQGQVDINDEKAYEAQKVSGTVQHAV